MHATVYWLEELQELSTQGTCSVHSLGYCISLIFRHPSWSIFITESTLLPISYFPVLRTTQNIISPPYPIFLKLLNPESRRLSMYFSEHIHYRKASCYQPPIFQSWDHLKYHIHPNTIFLKPVNFQPRGLILHGFANLYPSIRHSDRISHIPIFQMTK